MAKVELAVQDSGPGIPADVTPTSLTRSSRQKRWGKGTGLGLSISHSIIKEHDDTLTAEGTPGQGTMFFVRLSLAAPVEEWSLGPGDSSIDDPGFAGQAALWATQKGC